MYWLHKILLAITSKGQWSLLSLPWGVLAAVGSFSPCWNLIYPNNRKQKSKVNCEASSEAAEFVEHTAVETIRNKIES